MADAYLASPASGSGMPVVLLHAWWGLTDDVRGFADRLARDGFTVAAPDLFRNEVATTVGDAERLADGHDEAFADAASVAAVDAVREAARSDTPVGAVGFSFGAAYALWLPAERPEVAATVVYYGTTAGPSLGRSRAPILGHFAEDDPYEDDDTIDALAVACRDAGRPFEIQRYAGTGHWFAEPSRDAYVPAAADLAFARTVEFLRRELATG